jgi:WD40 repeat protein
MKMKYDAFMSYSHSADGGLAPAVQKALHRFAKPWYRLRMLHIFRDQTSLAVTPELWGSIENALSQSKHFLLCASPEAAVSHWVRDEIEWWLRNRDSRRMFILLTAGDILWDPKIDDFDWKTTTALPRTLSGAFTAEPLYVDLRFARDADDLSLRNASFRAAILDLAAPLHDRPKDELGGQDVREHRRALRIAVAAVVTLVILLIGAVTAAWIATVQRDLSRSRELAALARNQLGNDPVISLALATNAMEIRPTIQARQMLRTSLLRSLVRGVFERHTNAITSIHAMKSDDRVASIGLDGRMFVWNLADYSLHLELEGYRGAVSANGQRAVTSVNNNRLAVWDLSNGEKIAIFDGHTDTIFTAAISSDGRMAASGGRDKTVHIYDIETNRPVGNPIRAGGIVTDLTFHPNGNMLVIGSIYNRMVVWDLAANKKYLETKGISAAFSPDGTLLVTGGADNNGGRLVDLETGRALGTIEEMPGSNPSITFSPGGELFAAASSDGTARVWRRNGDLVVVLSGHDDWVEDVAFGPNGNFVVTGSRDHTARIWSVKSGREIATLRGHGAKLTVTRFSPDGRSIITGAANGSLRVWDTGIASPHRVFSGSKRTVQQLAFSPEGRYLIAAGDNGFTEIWDQAEDMQTANLPGTVFALGTDMVATAGNDHIVRLWEMSGSLKAELGRHADIVSGLTFSSDGRMLVSTSEDGTALLFDVVGFGKPRAIAHKGGLSNAAFSRDGSLLATAAYNGTVRLWRLPELTEIAKLEHSGKIISKVAFTATKDRVVTASWDGTIGIWNTEQGVRRHSLETDLDKVYTFEFIGDDGRLIAGGANGNLELWDAHTGRRLAEYRGHSDGIYNIVINPTVGLAASASNDATARLWDVQTGEEIAVFTAHGGSVWSVAFSPDGRLIATGSEDGDIHVYACGICASDDVLMATAKRRLKNLPPFREAGRIP